MDEWRQLGPFSKLDGSNTYTSYVVVIDALDECEGQNYIEIILRLLAEARSLKKVRLRVLITSSPRFQSAAVSARFLALSIATLSYMT
jgi:hypothetical protein